MITYWTIKYRLNDPDKAPEFSGLKTANIVAKTKSAAVSELMSCMRCMRPEIIGDPVRGEMTDEEYENG